LGTLPHLAKQYIRNALQKHKGQIHETAKELSLGLRTLHTYLETLDLRDEALDIRLANGLPPRGALGHGKKRRPKRKA
jgi:hypothetical protein